MLTLEHDCVSEENQMCCRVQEAQMLLSTAILESAETNQSENPGKSLGHREGNQWRAERSPSLAASALLTITNLLSFLSLCDPRPLAAPSAA